MSNGAAVPRLNVRVAELLIHIDVVPLILPAGSGLIVKVTEEEADAHGPLPLAVNVSVTLPATVSAALGV